MKTIHVLFIIVLISLIGIYITIEKFINPGSGVNIPIPTMPLPPGIRANIPTPTMPLPPGVREIMPTPTMPNPINRQLDNNVYPTMPNSINRQFDNNVYTTIPTNLGNAPPKRIQMREAVIDAITSLKYMNSSNKILPQQRMIDTIKSLDYVASNL